MSSSAVVPYHVRLRGANDRVELVRSCVQPLVSWELAWPAFFGIVVALVLGERMEMLDAAMISVLPLFSYVVGKLDARLFVYKRALKVYRDFDDDEAAALALTATKETP